MNPSSAAAHAEHNTKHNAEHNAAQRDYYRREDLRRLRLGRTPTVERHLTKTLTAAHLAQPGEILEIGAGLGRFTTLLSDLGHSVVACDLSRELLDELDARQMPRVETFCCDAAEIADRSGRSFKHAVGFFVLHHLPDLEAFFHGLAKALEPGARIAFCEPNAYHLPYYAQITFAPGMSWRGDGGVARMRPGSVFPALASAGFDDFSVDRYGFLPPLLANTSMGSRVERLFEAPRWSAPLRAYQVFSATRGEA